MPLLESKILPIRFPKFCFGRIGSKAKNLQIKNFGKNWFTFDRELKKCNENWQIKKAVLS